MAEKVSKSMVSSIRWTAEEHSYLTEKTKAWNVSIAAFIRTSIRIALGIPTKEEANIRRFQELEDQLRGLAGNFNQLTRAANAGKVMWTASDAELVSDLSVAVSEARSLFREHKRQASQRGFDKASIQKGP